MSAHTPGPWYLIRHPNERGVAGAAWTVQDRAFGGGKCIAQQYGRDGDEDRANARLIAAAPSLLAFAKAHDAYMRAAGYEGPESAALHPAAAENWRACLSAIHAATGEK